jgi:hypothetical protein
VSSTTAPIRTTRARCTSSSGSRERDLARAAAAELPVADGAAILDVYLDWTFRDVAQMLTRPPLDYR